ncbi:flagellar basal body-associated FliL family protein [Arhodomonas sp. AD133]|uniref:flagellar basal body-associated FliL family protein n=1 Tax=Arhodomonas sp. AD133 TaxID=3415009 RepID=UPI003EC0CC1E
MGAALGPVVTGAAPRRRQRGMSVLVLVLIVVLGMLVLGGGTVAALYFTGVIGGGDPASAEQPEEPEPEPPQYLPLEPPLVVNIDNSGRTSYLQVGVELMARDKSVIEAVQSHMPVVRNNLLLLFGNQSQEEITTREGKQALRMKALAEVNTVLAEQSVEGEIEAVYFTSFVVQ